MKLNWFKKLKKFFNLIFLTFSHKKLYILKHKINADIYKYIKRKSMNKENEKSNLNITLESKKSKYKKNIKLRITYLTTVIQFLDLNSLISLSLVNKEFYYFLSSIYVYKFIIQIQRHQKIMKYNNKKDIKSIKSDNINKTTNLNKKGGYSFFSALTGALSYFTPSTELNNIKT